MNGRNLACLQGADNEFREERAHCEEVERGHRRLSLLVVDDSAVVRQRLRQFLIEKCRLRLVREAADGAEGWRLFEQHRPDAVLLDIHLPDHRGFELLCRIKGAAPSCPVIILTNLRDSIFRRETGRRGADHFLHKATEFERVADLLHRYAARSGAAASAAVSEEGDESCPRSGAASPDNHGEAIRH